MGGFRTSGVRIPRKSGKSTIFPIFQIFLHIPIVLHRPIAPPTKTDLQPAYGVHSHSHPTSNHSLPEGPGQLPDTRTPTANHSAKKKGSGPTRPDPFRHRPYYWTNLVVKLHSTGPFAILFRFIKVRHVLDVVGNGTQCLPRWS